MQLHRTGADLFTKLPTTIAAVAILASAIILSACTKEYVAPTRMSGPSLMHVLSGNSVTSDMVTVPGTPPVVFLHADGTMVGTNLKRGQGSRTGAWLVKDSGYFCVKWPNWGENFCGYVRNYHNGEYEWRGNVLTILAGNPHAL